MQIFVGQPLAHYLAGRIARWREDQLEAQLREAALRDREGAGAAAAAEGASNSGAGGSAGPDGVVVVGDSKDVGRV